MMMHTLTETVYCSFVLKLVQKECNRNLYALVLTSQKVSTGRMVQSGAKRPPLFSLHSHNEQMQIFMPLSAHDLRTRKNEANGQSASLAWAKKTEHFLLFFFFVLFFQFLVWVGMSHKLLAVDFSFGAKGAKKCTKATQLLKQAAGHSKSTTTQSNQEKTP